jgi:hypothetical protein
VATHLGLLRLRLKEILEKKNELSCHSKKSFIFLQKVLQSKKPQPGKLSSERKEYFCPSETKDPSFTRLNSYCTSQQLTELSTYFTTLPDDGSELSRAAFATTLRLLALPALRIAELIKSVACIKKKDGKDSTLRRRMVNHYSTVT